MLEYYNIVFYIAYINLKFIYPTNGVYYIRYIRIVLIYFSDFPPVIIMLKPFRCTNLTRVEILYFCIYL